MLEGQIFEESACNEDGDARASLSWSWVIEHFFIVWLGDIFVKYRRVAGVQTPVDELENDNRHVSVRRWSMTSGAIILEAS